MAISNLMSSQVSIYSKTTVTSTGGRPNYGYGTARYSNIQVSLQPVSGDNSGAFGLVGVLQSTNRMFSDSLLPDVHNGDIVVDAVNGINYEILYCAVYLNTYTEFYLKRIVE